MIKFGVGVPLLVITQLMLSPAKIVKLTGMLVKPDTSVPVGLALLQATVWA